MTVSGEARWFWRTTPPHDLEPWFVHRPIAPGGGKTRVDEYLIDSAQHELGIKRRGEIVEGAPDRGIEIKGLVEVRGPLPQPFNARVQVWSKWTSSALRIDNVPLVRVRKTRRLRKFDTSGSVARELALNAGEQLIDQTVALPAQGCHFEFVELEVGDARERWWTLAFEAFGPLATIEESLASTLAALEPLDAAVFSSGLELSYPAWLATQAGR